MGSRWDAYFMYYENMTSHPTKFRFKSKRKRGEDENERPSGSHTEERHHRHHHHRSKRSRTSPSATKDDPSLYDDTHLPNTSSSQYLDPDAAFRESLFDAMADDEAAQYWEGVYGQPIHTYPDVKQGPTGELEQMTDEEYAAYVRGKMYEKTHQHLMEEKARREAAKKERERLAQEGRKEEREAERFRIQIEESLRRGQERRSRKVWTAKWNNYIKNWEELEKNSSRVAIVSIPWPVESGSRKDVKLEEIRRFFLYAPTSGEPTESQLTKTLKVERVRWHPDKIQQKLGGQDVDEGVMQAVTAVFQIVDGMWSESRNRK
ncbi:88929379-2770-47d6-b20b-fd95b121499e-CDS [Sclerotinia trifoliorum]|uniref:88929379-2770-47d6-b20b-fd95b121499e-CDS n=1 Tax=Sclerotinia trifoliorum TaxID=28548 RepID=A0A8H2VUB3_9HELO|nr:88929379-2770-47d6-b20b-fd95b121499e-CDS [Sclerotinia trifoliorum]